MFNTRPQYEKYRALHLVTPLLVGEDVYALQTALNDVLTQRDIPQIAPDGWFGEDTLKATKAVQSVLKLVVDGRVGPATWNAVGKDVAVRARQRHHIAIGLLYGQLAHESSLRGGMYSDLNRNGTWDVGIAQLNSHVHPDFKASFTVPYAVNLTAKQTREFYEEFAGVAERRRWALAAGAHNAPAWARYLAREEGATRVRKADTALPTATQRKVLEEYITSVTAYMR